MQMPEQQEGGVGKTRQAKDKGCKEVSKQIQHDTRFRAQGTCCLLFSQASREGLVEATATAIAAALGINLTLVWLFSCLAAGRPPPTLYRHLLAPINIP